MQLQRYTVAMVSAKENDRILHELNDKKILDYAPAIAYSALVIILGISGNIFSIAFYGFKSPRNTTNRLIVVLATTDLIACIVFCDEIIELCFTITFKNVPACKVLYFAKHTLVLWSSFILVLISVDRFQKICKRQSWQLNVTSAKMCTGALLLLAVLLSVRYFVIIDVVEVYLTVPGRNDTITGFYCTHTRETEKKAANTAFQLLLDLFTLIVVISTLTILYTFVAREIWIQRKIKESHMQFTSAKSCASETESAEVEGLSSVSAEETTSTNLPEGTAPNACRSEEADLIEISSASTGKENECTSEESKSGHFTKRCKTALKKIPVKSFKDHDEHHLKGKHSEVVEKKIAVMMIVITAASILSFLPYFIVNLALKRNSNTPEQEFSVGIQIALRSYMINNAVNPYIMCLFNTQFRHFVKDSVCKCRQVSA